jgi:hypothetical protein
VAPRVFICLVTGAVAPTYEVNWICVWCHGGRDDRGVLTPPYIGRGVGLQRGRSTQQIGFLVCYNRLILSYHSYDGGRYL